MIFEAVRSKGRPNLSYVVGDGGVAAVIDPRRDCRAYLEIAYRAGARITHIIETHRGEDYLSGSRELSLQTAAPIFHGGQTAFLFGNPVFEDDTFDLGKVRLSILETPGHTPESVSIVLTDRDRSDNPFAVFTGDTLLAGDTGRIDLPEGNPHENAGNLHDSIFNRLLPLGDQVIVYPARETAHLTESFEVTRNTTTIGYERENNPHLRFEGRDDFIEYKLREQHPVPPSYHLLSRYNREGPPLLNGIPLPQPHSVEDFVNAMDLGMFVLDLRSPEAISCSHIPGSLALPLSQLPTYAGWLIPYDRQIGLVSETYLQAEEAVHHLIDSGFDSIHACLVDSLYAWEDRNRTLGRFPLLSLSEIRQRYPTGSFIVLDVRSPGEYSRGHLPDSRNIPLEELSDRIREVPRSIPVICFCEMGTRAVIAASLLLLNGYNRIEAGRGSLAACAVLGCELVMSEDH